MPDLFGTPDLHLTLNAGERAKLQLPVAPVDGGHEDFLRVLQGRLDGHSLALSDAEMRRAFRYTKGSGGHQDRFQAVVTAAWRAGWVQP
jgi:hypothetical protein